MIKNFLESRLIEALGLLVNILTLLFAYRIYRNFDIKKSHINKQLETVLSLVQSINDTLILTNYRSKIPQKILDTLPEQINYRSVVTSWYFSLFMIADFKNEHDKKTNNKDIYLSANIKTILPFLSYINNPLLPKSIAEKLSKFYSPFIKYGTFDKASEEFVELMPLKHTESEAKFQLPDLLDTYHNWANFISCSRNLKKEIENWLNKYGSEDINFNLYLQHPKL